MKCAYEAANGVEAHMIANLLEQSGVATRIDGEHLASGVGELPAAGLVRVMVEEGQHTRAREVIREWEEQSTRDVAPPSNKRLGGLTWFAAGVVVGAGAMAWINHTIVSASDKNRTTLQTAMGGTMLAAEFDINRDGEADQLVRFDRYGTPIGVESLR